jgi:hypothetical protein
MSQTESGRTVAANRLIEQLMKAVLGLSPGTAGVRLALVRNESGRLRYDVTNGVAAPGRWIGPMRPDEPLSDWGDFLAPLLAGQCVLHRVLDVRDAAPAFSFPSAHPSRALVCPVAGMDGHLLGAMFIMWDCGAQPPEHEGLHRLMAASKRVATQIAAVINLCGERPLPIPDRVLLPDHRP